MVHAATLTAYIHSVYLGHALDGLSGDQQRGGGVLHFVIVV